MKCKWIIENFTDAEDYRELIKAVKDSGRDCFVIDKNNHFDFDPRGFNENDCVIVQGSIQMTKNIQSRLPKGCFPIAYSSWHNYLCSSYYPAYKDFLFNDYYKQTTIKELKDNKFDFYRIFGKEAVIFVRPDSGEKTFSGQLIDLQDFDRFWNNNIVFNGQDSDIVYVSTPKTINGEWRFVCSKYNNTPEIIAYSTYSYQGQKTLVPGAPQGAIDLCQRILKVDYKPDNVFCVDICEDFDGNFWLLELTSFSSAGLYATNKNKIVTRLNHIVEDDYQKHLTESKV